MKTLIFISVLLLTGCSTTSSTETFQSVRNHYNQMDPCQYWGKAEGHVLPNYCFANAGKTVYSVRDINNRIIYTIR